MTNPFWWSLPRELDIDRAALEVVWSKLDVALDQQRLSVRHYRGSDGSLRIVQTLGLLEFIVDEVGGQIRSYAIEPDGSRRRIPRGLFICQMLKNCFWMRIAFQQWAPITRGIDFIEDPNNRPWEVELNTQQTLIRRLHLDRRYWTLIDDLDTALGIPDLVMDHIRIRDADREQSHIREGTVNDAWAEVLETRGALDEAIYRVKNPYP